MLGQRLSKKLDIPYYDLDDFYWLPHWQAKPLEKFLNDVTVLAKQEAWIIAGYYNVSNERIWTAADTILWLDLPLWLCLWRLSVRSLQWIIFKKAVCNGNYETLSLLLSHHSVLLWAFTSYAKRNASYQSAKQSLYKDKNWFHFKNQKDVCVWLKALS